MSKNKSVDDKSRSFVNKLKVKLVMDQRIRDLAKTILDQEKREAGLSPEDLYYIGIADTSSWWWCGRKSVLMNKKMELEFFLAHLYDRILYSAILGYLPERSESLESIISKLPELRWEDVENVLKIISEMPKERLHDDIIELLAIEGETTAEREGIRAHYKIAECYPTIRWAFRWKDFMIVGVPDGITDNFVYEFKTIGGWPLMRYIRPVAFAQADLYGYFFKRPLKRVQIYLRDTEEILTWTEPVDKKNAEITLESFREAVRENIAPILPVEWKCKNCGFWQECILVFGKMN